MTTLTLEIEPVALTVTVTDTVGESCERRSVGEKV